ncbi:MAG: hypothetical protein ABW121_18950 [Candidatus Thiodiazotropha sp. 6PLUC7]
MAIGPMMAMMGIGSLMSQPSINEGIERVITPVIDPINQNIIGKLTDPLGKLTGSAGQLLGDVIDYTPVGILADVISLAFDKPEPIWEPDEETDELINEAVRKRIAMVTEWQLFGESALQPWHGLEAFQALELQLYGQHDDSGELPEPIYADAFYELDEDDAISDKDEILEEHSRDLVKEFADQSAPDPIKV